MRFSLQFERSRAGSLQIARRTLEFQWQRVKAETARQQRKASIKSQRASHRWSQFAMTLSDGDYSHDSTYIGVWSATQAARISELLEDLGVRYEFVIEDQAEERLREWMAWDPTSASPYDGHELFIHSDDLEKVGTRILDMYPERNFGAA